MIKTLVIFSLLFAIASCSGLVNHTYNHPDDPISYRKVDYHYSPQFRRSLDSVRYEAYADTIFIDRLITVQLSLHTAYNFKLNKTCVYSFMSPGSDSGPIYWQYKGKYEKRNDSIILNFTESRSVGYNAKHHSNMKIEDSQWKNMDFLYSNTFIASEKRDTLWTIQRSGLKGSI